jgi:predicted phosphodiesterase
MRLAVISDIHGNLTATEAVLTDIEQLDHPVDVIVCTGDIVGHGAQPNEVLALLTQRKVRMIRGNYDEAVAGTRTQTGIDYAQEAEERVDVAALSWTREHLSPENMELLRSLPADARMAVTRGGRQATPLRESEDPAKQQRRTALLGMFVGSAVAGMGKPPRGLLPRRVLFVHGSPRDVVEHLYPGTATSVLRTIADRAEADVIVHGHTHQPSQSEVSDVRAEAQRKPKQAKKGSPSQPATSKVTFIGVGSVGRSPRPGVAEYAIIQIVGPEIDVDFRSVDYDLEREARAIESSGLPVELAHVLRTGSFPSA